MLYKCTYFILPQIIIIHMKYILHKYFFMHY